MQKRRYRLAAESEIPDGQTLVVALGERGERCGVARYAGQYYAFGCLCPHQNAPLDRAPVEDGVVTCVRHYYRFDIRTGDCLTLGGYGLPVFTTAVESGTVYADIWEYD